MRFLSRRIRVALLLSSFALSGTAPRVSAQLLVPPERREARAILQQLVSINSTTGSLGVQKAARAMAARFIAAGYAAADVQLVGPTPPMTALVVRLRGRQSAKKPILLLAHLDVVAAKRADWPFDPFSFVEKDGFYYGRGAEDDKAGVATIVANMVRWKREMFIPDRDLVAVFTADEETDGNSMRWLLKNHHELLDAEYALNADAGGGSMDKGTLLFNSIQASEKVYADFRVEVTNPGGHSSVPRTDNAIYELSAALAAFGKHEFPVRLNEVSRAFFQQSAAMQKPEVASLMRAVAAQPTDLSAAAKLASINAYWNSVMRTTCVATMLDGGHATNALPQRAGANINCRMLPDDPADSVLAVLRRVIGPSAKVTQTGQSVPSPASPLRPDVMRAVEAQTKAQFPGAAVVPEMSTGATDGLFTRNAGIPTYGVSAIFFEQSEPSRAHGREERVGVKAFHDAVAFWYSMVKSLTTPQVTP